MVGVPSYNRENTLAPPVLPEGPYNVSLERMEHKTAKNGGNDMLVGRFVVDTGQHMGAFVENLFYFGHQNEFGEKALQTLANFARRDDGSLNPKVDGSGNVTAPGGFVFTSDVPDWTAFGNQFVTNPPLRVKVKVYHTYDIERNDDDWERKVKKDVFDAFVAGGGRGSIKANLRIEAPPSEKATLPVKPITTGVTPKATYPGGGAGQVTGVAAADEEDDLPF